MKIQQTVILVLLLMIFVSCSGSIRNEAKEQTIEKGTYPDKTLVDNDEGIGLIKSVYDIFVFAIDADGDDIEHPEKFFTAHALEKLRKDYEFDCEDEPCYAYHALRSDAQDSMPGSDGESVVCGIDSAQDGWYMVSYLDMGWPGKTRIKLADGKIDDYERQAD